MTPFSLEPSTLMNNPHGPAAHPATNAAVHGAVSGMREHSGDLVAIDVNGNEVARLPSDIVRALGIGVGVEWSEPLKAEVLAAHAAHQARAHALRALAASGKTTRELIQRLERAGFDPAAVELVVQDLVRRKLVDDREVASSVTRDSSRNYRSPEAARAKMEHRLVDPAAATRALRTMESERSTHDRAREAANALVRRFPPFGDARKRFARLVRALASKGYEDDVALAAAESVLGAPPEDSPDSDAVDA